MFNLSQKILPLFIFFSLVYAANDTNIIQNLSDANLSDENATEANNTYVDGTKMLWEVDGLHGGKVYLFGSIHVGKADLYPLDKNITQAFNDSNYLVVETKSNESSKIAMNTLMFKNGRFSDTTRLKDVISSKNYERLQIKLKQLKMLPGSLDAFRPWVASLVITMTEIIQLGYSPQFGMDLYFEEKASQDQKRIFSMESVHEQFGLFSDQDDSFGEKLLELTFNTGFSRSSDIEDFFTKWQEGSTSYFEEKIIKPMDSYPKIKEDFLIKRNKKMVDKVNIYRGNKKGRSYFVVMGLAHLLGEEGVVQQLKDQNLTVRRAGGYYINSDSNTSMPLETEEESE